MTFSTDPVPITCGVIETGRLFETWTKRGTVIYRVGDTLSDEFHMYCDHNSGGYVEAFSRKVFQIGRETDYEACERYLVARIPSVNYLDSIVKAIEIGYYLGKSLSWVVQQMPHQMIEYLFSPDGFARELAARVVETHDSPTLPLVREAVRIFDRSYGFMARLAKRDSSEIKNLWH